MIQGEIWPKPYQQKSSDFFSTVRPSFLRFKVKFVAESDIDFLFEFELFVIFHSFCLHFCWTKFYQIQNEDCDILDEAIQRYKHIIRRMLKRDRSAKHTIYDSNLIELPYPEFRNNAYFIGYMDEITINLKNPCEKQPNPRMQEDCEYSKPWKYQQYFGRNWYFMTSLVKYFHFRYIEYHEFDSLPRIGIGLGDFTWFGIIFAVIGCVIGSNIGNLWWYLNTIQFYWGILFSTSRMQVDSSSRVNVFLNRR